MGPFRTIKIHMPNLSMTVQLLNNLCFPLLSSKGVAMKAFKKACRKIVSELMTISGNVFAEQPHIHLEKIEQLSDGYTHSPNLPYFKRVGSPAAALLISWSS